VFLSSAEEWKAKTNAAIAALDTTVYKDQRVVVKGCGDEPVPEAAYLEITTVRPVKAYVRRTM
jgi:thioredoxin reductase